MAGGVGLWDWDLQGEQVRLSPNLEALLALPSGAFSGTRDGFLELLHPLDRGRIAAALKAARHGTVGRTELEFRVTSAEGQLRWFVMRAEIAAAEPGGRPRLAGTMQEISATIVVERRMRRQHAALLDLATRDWLRTAPLTHALARLSEVAADTLDGDRVGIWLYDDERTLIRCLELFERTARRPGAIGRRRVPAARLRGLDHRQGRRAALAHGIAGRSNAADATIVRSTINLAHNLGLAVVAEGIESEASWDSLRCMGCDEAQGYWIAKPMPAVEVEAWYRSARWKPGGVAVTGRQRRAFPYNRRSTNPVARASP